MPDNDNNLNDQLILAEETFQGLRPIGSRDLLLNLGQSILLGQSISSVDRAYIGLALIYLSRGKTFRESFNMQPTGRPRDRGLYLRDLRIAVYVFQQMQTGLSMEKASFAASEAYNVSDSTAQKAYKRFSRRFKISADITNLLRLLDETESQAWQ